MIVNTVDFEGQSIQVLELPNRRLLFRTKDICRISGITERPKGTVLGLPCMDLASAINVANDEKFAEWLIETFAGFSTETGIHPNCDDDWESLRPK